MILKRKTRLRNPGLYSFLIFLAASGLVVALYVLGSPDAVKLATELVGIAVAAFGAKSAIERQTVAVNEDGKKTLQKNTWPGKATPAKSAGDEHERTNES
jgi:hypothetical protein